MTIKTRNLHYSDGKTLFHAVLAWNADINGERPAVLVSHTWGGCSDFEIDKAKMLAELGYVGIAIDMYGEGKQGADMEENAALMTPLVENRDELQKRIGLAFTAAKAEPEVDASKIGAIGFCFGGLCVLDLARTGADVKGVVSFHGLLGAPGNTDGNNIGAKVLCLHGWDDPMATPDNVLAFATEMTTAKADWQLHAYGNTAHAFTFPAAQMPEMGMQYKPEVAARAFNSMTSFLAEVFA